jgi:hypothetical protein
MSGNQALSNHADQTGSIVNEDNKQVCFHMWVAVELVVIAPLQCSCI